MTTKTASYAGMILSLLPFGVQAQSLQPVTQNNQQAQIGQSKPVKKPAVNDMRLSLYGGVHTGSGYIPGLAGGTTLTYQRGKFGGEASFLIDSSNKRDARSGLGVSGEGLLRLYPIKNLFLETGISAGRLMTKDYTKTAVRPLVGGGLEFFDGDFRIFGDFIPRDGTLNNVRGGRIGVQMYTPLSSKIDLYMQMRGSVFKFNTTGVNNALTGRELGGDFSIYAGLSFRNRARTD